MTGQTLGGGIPLVRSLPTGQDGAIIRFQDSTTVVDGGTATMASLGIEWLLVYNGQSASSLKWEVIGGSPLISFSAVRDVSASMTQIPATTYTTILDTVTAPLAGDYTMDHGGNMTSVPGSTNSYLGLHLNGVNQSSLELVGSIATPEFHQLSTRQNGVTAAMVFTLRTRVDTLNASAKYGSHWVRLMPIRVG